ncbi:MULTISPECIES: DUF2795 domain-containing protein [Actinokineospora]|uniref:DUF2795 domain-containing protein n=1 Tax=Actinokineospora fastidiosa TaxID=1816 RepID=A0A918LEI3_9PSEU|nr:MULTISPECIES: DUF2795 domain-containing protein [Actinokineospora]UVS80679.1 hypothetical protein Actkin_04431 [Actinokineospora sp. UTMC 2448]GGS36440.1 hypothetical protein GCM10010171_33950 [Actinokineospora fastidiosa]
MAPNPIQMQKFLSGVNYPCSKSDLVEHARSSGADDDVVNGLEAMPDREYDGPNAVSEAFTSATR